MLYVLFGTLMLFNLGTAILVGDACAKLCLERYNAHITGMLFSERPRRALWSGVLAQLLLAVWGFAVRTAVLSLGNEGLLISVLALYAAVFIYGVLVGLTLRETGAYPADCEAPMIAQYIVWSGLIFALIALPFHVIVGFLRWWLSLPLFIAGLFR